MKPIQPLPAPTPEATPEALDADALAARAFALERFLPYRLSVLANYSSRAFARRYGDAFGLTIPEWRVMAVLARFAPLSANEVAERTAMDKVRVSRAVARLLKTGLVDRTTAREDRRRSTLRLSRAGRKIHAAIVPLARALEAELLAGIGEAERAQLERLMDKLLARARSLGGGNGAEGPD